MSPFCVNSFIIPCFLKKETVNVAGFHFDLNGVYSLPGSGSVVGHPTAIRDR
jgi:hypothetical protein